MNEKTELSDEHKRIKELADIQAREAGTGDTYMVGLFNGLELALATMENREPKFARAASPSSKSTTELPALLFDGYYVWNEGLTDAAKRRTSPENVSDVLDAVVRLMRASSSIKEDGERAEVVAYPLSVDLRRATPSTGWLVVARYGAPEDAQALRAALTEPRKSPGSATTKLELSSPPSPLGDTPDQQEQKR